jgi:hypothetical protein
MHIRPFAQRKEDLDPQSDVHKKHMVMKCMHEHSQFLIIF